MQHRLTLAVLVSASAWLMPSVAAADPNGASAAAAEVLFREGSALLKAGDIERACPKLQSSYSLDPALGTLGLLAYCHEQQGRLASAWQEYLKVASEARATRQTERERIARMRAAELEPRLSRLQLRVANDTPGLEVFLDARRLLPEELGLALPLDGGTRVVEARAPGCEPWRHDVELATEGALVSLEVPKLEPRVAQKPAAVPAPLPASLKASTLTPKPNLVPVLAASSVALLGASVGAYFGLKALATNKESEPYCERNACSARGVALRDDALSAARVSTIGFVVSGVGLASAVLLYELPRMQTKNALVAGVASTPSSVLFTLQGSVQ